LAFKVSLGLIGFFLLNYVVAVYWSIEPDAFDVSSVAKAQAALHDEKLVTGYTTTTTLIEIADTLLSKSGGYLSNDKLPPSLFMDNMPAWELGVLTQVRDMALIMRRDFSRSQSQSRENDDLKIAQPKFYIDNRSWMFPSAENEYREADQALLRYRTKLADPANNDAQFYARADNLVSWLNEVQSRLGALSQKLSASVGRSSLNTDLAGDAQAEQSTAAPSESVFKTSWSQLDDVFYEARGSSWALLHLLNAIEIDFKSVLEKKNAVVSVRQIVRELEATQQTMWSPMVLNGRGFGVVANHSLVMANYISRSNAAVIDLIELLNNG
jgi:hypothetical protein